MEEGKRDEPQAAKKEPGMIQQLLLLAVGVVALIILVSVVVSNSEDASGANGAGKYMVVTANPLSTLAAENILAAGGTAADAMVAAQTVLSLVEPQSSGLGGGAFLVYYDAESGNLTTYDGREKAPAAATPERFVGLGFVDGWQSGLSVGVPGTVKLMHQVQQIHGNFNWSSGELFAAARDYAANGYSLTQRSEDQVASLLARNTDCNPGSRLTFPEENAFNMFVDFTTDAEGTITSCSAKPAGTLMTNQEYVNTLDTIQADVDDFYTGAIAEAIAAAVQGDLRIPGDMTVEDLANYEVIEREPVCQEYRGYNVCGMGPPSSGALAVGQILGMLETFEPNLEGEEGLPYPLNVDDVHLMTQAMRLAFADRGLYVGDSDFVEVPVAGMLDKTYLAERAELIEDGDMGTAEAGVPPGAEDLAYMQTNRAKLSGTSHVSIVDSYGNALSLTTTIESSFGNGVMVNGFMLNNELTDFNFQPTDGVPGRRGLQERPAANRVQANKRPRSSMAPTIVMRDGVVTHVTGSPGGSSIIGYTAQSIVNMIDYGLSPDASIRVPHYQNRNGATNLEIPLEGITIDYDIDLLTEALEGINHTVAQGSATSGLSVIEILRDGSGGVTLVGGGDLRRDGTVGGN